MDERYRTLALVVVVTIIVTTVSSLTCPHGWPIPTGLLIAIAAVVALPIGWLARSTFVAVAAALGIGVIIGAPFIAPIALTLIAVATLAEPSLRRS